MSHQNSYTENELVAALKCRENAAYHYLYLYYRGSLFSIINQIVPDTETANDVLQEVFVSIWKNIDKYDPEKGRLFTWLLNLTRNMAINKTRSKNYKNFLKTADIENFVNGTEINGVCQKEINHIGLRNEVKKLKAEHKDVVELSYFKGFTQVEIAETLNIPLGTVKTRLRSALLELRKQFS